MWVTSSHWKCHIRSTRKWVVLTQTFMGCQGHLPASWSEKPGEFTGRSVGLNHQLPQQEREVYIHSRGSGSKFRYLCTLVTLSILKIVCVGEESQEHTQGCAYTRWYRYIHTRFLGYFFIKMGSPYACFLNLVFLIPQYLGKTAPGHLCNSDRLLLMTARYFLAQLHHMKACFHMCPFSLFPVSFGTTMLW